MQINITERRRLDPSNENSYSRDSHFSGELFLNIFYGYTDFETFRFDPFISKMTNKGNMSKCCHFTSHSRLSLIMPMNYESNYWFIIRLISGWSFLLKGIQSGYYNRNRWRKRSGLNIWQRADEGIIN